jgi:hypothetical protein
MAAPEVLAVPERRPQVTRIGIVLSTPQREESQPAARHAKAFEGYQHDPTR